MALPPSRPLRTGHVGFPTSGSSLSDPFLCRRRRFRYGETLAVNLLVTRWMEKDAIVSCIWSPFGSPKDMMAMPSGNFGDLLVADWAQTALFFPKVDEPLFPFGGVYHLHVEPFFKVAFPCWIVWVRLPLNSDVPFDGHTSRFGQIVLPLIKPSSEHPIVSAGGFEVFLRDPFFGFAWMFPLDPLSQDSIDRVINRTERFFAHHMLVVVGPASDHGIQLDNQPRCRQCLVRFHCGPDLFQKRLYILLGRLDQQFVPFACLILAHILSQEVEAFFYLGDDCFLSRELQPPFPQELLHQRLDFIFKELFGSSGNDEVIGKSDEVEFGSIVLAVPLRVVRKSCL
jgi:hypothetical protein